MSKNRVIVEAALAGRSQAAVAEQYGISKVWVGKLMARWRTGGLKSIQWQCRCPHQNDKVAPRRIQQPRLPFISSETSEAPRKVRPGRKGNHLKVNKVPGQGLTMSRDLTIVQLKPFDPESKGIVERANKYLETSFLPRRVFTCPQDFNDQLQ